MMTATEFKAHCQRLLAQFDEHLVDGTSDRQFDQWVEGFFRANGLGPEGTAAMLDFIEATAIDLDTDPAALVAVALVSFGLGRETCR